MEGGSQNAYNIGIDLGTSSCSVSVFCDDKVTVIPIDNGAKFLPSYVYFRDGIVSVGRVAMMNARKEPKRVIHGMKRMLGLMYDDPDFQRDLKNYEFETRRSETGNIEIVVDGCTYTPVQVTAFLIAHIVNRASQYLKGPINEAFISVPAYYNNVQRNDTINAGLIAGLQRVHLVSEPVASVISYGIMNSSQKEMALVFDFGGGKLDVEVVGISNYQYTVMSSMGDYHFGGDEITALLLEEVVKAFSSQFGLDIRSSRADFMRLFLEVEEAKVSLSYSDSYDIDEEDLMGEEFHFSVTRALMERLCRDVFGKCMKVVQDTLAAGDMRNEDITKVLMVGGSSNIPYLRKKMTDLFGDRVVACAEAGEMVSNGAAIMAGVSHDVQEKGFDFQIAMYTTTHNRGNEKWSSKSLTVNDITPMNLGVRVSSGALSSIIPALSNVPCAMRKRYQIHRDYQPFIRIKVYQGNNPLVADCKLISDIRMDLKKPGRVSETMVDVEFALDSNSTLFVKATEVSTGDQIEKVMDMGTQVLKEEQVNSMRESLQTTIIASERKEKLDLAKLNFQKYINQVSSYLNSLPDDDEVKRKKQLVRELKGWLQESSSLTVEDITEKQNELKRVIYGHCLCLLNLHSFEIGAISGMGSLCYSFSIGYGRNHSEKWNRDDCYRNRTRVEKSRCPIYF